MTVSSPEPRSGRSRRAFDTSAYGPSVMASLPPRVRKVVAVDGPPRAAADTMLTPSRASQAASNASNCHARHLLLFGERIPRGQFAVTDQQDQILHNVLLSSVTECPVTMVSSGRRRIDNSVTRISGFLGDGAGGVRTLGEQCCEALGVQYRALQRDCLVAELEQAFASPTTTKSVLADTEATERPPRVTQPRRLVAGVAGDGPGHHDRQSGQRLRPIVLALGPFVEQLAAGVLPLRTISVCQSTVNGPYRHQGRSDPLDRR